jgi:hypothetical protein
MLNDHNKMDIGNGFVLIDAKNLNISRDLDLDLYTQLRISKNELNCFDGLIIPLWKLKKVGTDGMFIVCY